MYTIIHKRILLSRYKCLQAVDKRRVSSADNKFFRENTVDFPVYTVILNTSGYVSNYLLLQRLEFLQMAVNTNVQLRNEVIYSVYIRTFY